MGLSCQPAQFRALVSIANQTRIGQVVRNRLTTMLPADNVIDFMRESRILLMKQAILTSEHRALNHSARSSTEILKGGWPASVELWLWPNRAYVQVVRSRPTLRSPLLSTLILADAPAAPQRASGLRATDGSLATSSAVDPRATKSTSSM